MDSVQFALALEKYDVTVHQPHPPGYFLYVMLGRLFHLVIKDANQAYIAMNIILSGLTVIGVYYLGKEIFDGRTGILAAAVAITSPTFWFHGEVALSYAADAFSSTALAILCWKIYRGRHEYIWLSAVVLGIAGGMRQNTVVFLFPFWLFSVKGVPLRKIALSIGLLGLTCLLWFIPMVWMTGGWEAYKWAFGELWRFTAGLSSKWPLGLYSFTLLRFTGCGIGVGLFAIAFSAYSLIKSDGLKSLDRTKSAFFAFWILSPVFFYLVIGIFHGNPGMGLIYLPGLFIITSASMRYVSDKLKRSFKREYLVPVASSLLMINIIIFVSGHSPVSLWHINNHERKLSAILAKVRIFDPLDTLIIADPNIFFGFSELMYYLPEYRVYQFDTTTTPSGEIRRTLWGINRQTFLTDELVLPLNITRFAAVLFAEDKNRVDGVQGMATRIVVPGLYIAAGPVGRLQSVFPEMKVRPASDGKAEKALSLTCTRMAHKMTETSMSRKSIFAGIHRAFVISVAMPLKQDALEMPAGKIADTHTQIRGEIEIA